ncbi:MAG: hypothetical protein LLG16_06865 [Euryarchaeota archaeon]|nr:hypothetical protein [Euryarchaeota archaeon]
MVKNKRSERKEAIDPEKLEIGDVVAIEWYDVHAYERIEMSEIDELEEPEATRCWGAVVRKTKRFLFIASEIGDKDSDGVWIEALPYKMIEACKVIDRISLNDI